MNFTNYKYKLVASVSLLTAEKDRIQEIIIAYNIRLNTIYNNISSLLDDLERINFIENIADEKERIINLINIVHNIKNNDEETKIKNNMDEKFKKIDDLKNEGLTNNNVNIYSNKFNEIKHACKTPLKKTEAENIINNYESTTTTPTTTEEDNTGEEETIIEESTPNKFNNNDDSNLKNVCELNINMNNNVNNNKNIDEKQKKRDEINKKRREKNMAEKLKIKQETEAKEREHNNKLLIKL